MIIRRRNRNSLAASRRRSEHSEQTAHKPKSNSEFDISTESNARDGVDELDKDLAEAFVHSRKYKKIRQPFPTSTTITWNKPHFLLLHTCLVKTKLKV